jgi:saccharopepsin
MSFRLCSSNSSFTYFSTGSSNLWVPGDGNSNLIPGCWSPACWLHQKFHPKQSSTFQPKSDIFSIQYGSGSLKGVTGKDVLRIGDITIQAQDFAMSTQEPGLAFALGKFDGILGLAYDHIAGNPKLILVNGVAPPFYQMIGQNIINDKLFGVYMGSTKTDTGGGSFKLVTSRNYFRPS